MGTIKDRIIDAIEARGVENLPVGWYVIDGSFHIGAGPFSTKKEAEMRIVSTDEKAAFIEVAAEE